MYYMHDDHEDEYLDELYDEVNEDMDEYFIQDGLKNLAGGKRTCNGKVTNAPNSEDQEQKRKETQTHSEDGERNRIVATVVRFRNVFNRPQ